MSTHLAVLREAGVVCTNKIGRRRIYRLTNDNGISKLITLLPDLGIVESRLPDGAARHVRRNTSIRQARSCYDHLAGVAGVEFLERLISLGWLVEAEGKDKRLLYDVTDRGRNELSARGIDVGFLHRLRRRFAFGCPDWTERSPHLGGVLGAAILERLLADGYVTKNDDDRSLTISRPVDRWLVGQPLKPNDIDRLKLEDN